MENSPTTETGSVTESGIIEIAVEVEETETETSEKRGMTREEIKLHLDLCRELCFDGDKVRQGNLPAGIVQKFNRNKLASMLELDPSTGKICWAMHRVYEARKGGMSFAFAADVLNKVIGRLDNLAARRKAAMEEIEELKLDPARVDGMTVAEIEAKLSAYKAVREEERKLRRYAAWDELQVLLKLVNQLEQRAGLLEVSEIKGVDAKTLSKDVAVEIRKKLLERKAEVENHLRVTLAEATKAKAKSAKRAA